MFCDFYYFVLGLLFSIGITCFSSIQIYIFDITLKWNTTHYSRFLRVGVDGNGCGQKGFPVAVCLTAGLKEPLTEDILSWRRCSGLSVMFLILQRMFYRTEADFFIAFLSKQFTTEHLKHLPANTGDLSLAQYALPLLVDASLLCLQQTVVQGKHQIIYSTYTIYLHSFTSSTSSQVMETESDLLLCFLNSTIISFLLSKFKIRWLFPHYVRRQFPFLKLTNIHTHTVYI